MKVDLDDWREIMCALERIIAANVTVHSFAMNGHIVYLCWGEDVPHVVRVESGRDSD